MQIKANGRVDFKAVASAFIGKLIELKPEVELVNVDLYDEKPPFYSYDLYKRAWYPVFNEGYEPSKVEEMSLNYANEQIEKFKEADVLVLTMPMWAYSVPAIMKAWIDQFYCRGIRSRLQRGWGSRATQD